MNKRFTALNAAEQLQFSKKGHASGRSVIFEAGVFNYRYFELGLPFDATEDGIIRLYYPPEFLGSAEVLATFDNSTITDDHPDTPDGLIDVTNYEGNAQGNLGTGATFVNNRVEALAHFMGKTVVTNILAGKRDLSIGAEIGVKLERGTTPAGVAYDARVVRFANNHCALVDKGRAPSARVILGDENDDPNIENTRILLNGFPSVDRELPTEAPQADETGTTTSLNSPSKERESKMKPDENKVYVTLNSKRLCFPDQESADKTEAVFNSMIDTHKTEVETLVANHETALGAESEKVATLTEEVASLKAQTTPEAIALNAAERTAVLDKATALDVKVANADTATIQDLRLQVLNGSAHPDAASFNAETPDEVAIAALNGLTASLPKAKNPLADKVVTNADTTSGQDTYQASLQNPASRTKK